MGRKSIRKLLRQDYESLADKGGYDAVGRNWGLTGGMVWRLMNEDGYWPSDPEIKKKIEIVARRRGVYINRGGRKKDLFSMDPGELRWQLENRVEV
mgnify:CR=1 FL=1